MKRLATILLLGCLCAFLASLSGCQTIDNPSVTINPDGTVAITDNKTGVTLLAPLLTPSK